MAGGRSICPGSDGACILLVLLNAHHEPVHFAVPPSAEGSRWVIEFYTAGDQRGPEEPVPAGPFELTGRSLAVFREVTRE
jgi:isoamylase